MTEILSPTTLRSLNHLLVRYCSGDPAVTEDDVRGEMRRYLTATSPDAKAAMAEIASAIHPSYPIDEDGTTVLVDTEDPTAPDGMGRTYYLTLITEVPR